MMYEESKNNSRYYYIGVAIALGFSFLLGRASVLYNGAGVDNPTNTISNAQRTTGQLATGISNAQNSAGEIRQTSNSIGKTISRIQSTITKSGDAIGECEQIVSAVRERGKVEIKTN